MKIDPYYQRQNVGRLFYTVSQKKRAKFETV